jgi:centromeric protein E
MTPRCSGFLRQGTRSDPGVIPLAVQDMFAHVERHADRAEFLLRFSYLEIYNERFYDLLAAGAKADVKMLDVAPRGAGGAAGGKDVALKGLREEIVLSAEHVLSLVDVGNLHRHMATTDANDQSSRSHVIFRMVRGSFGFLASVSAEGLTCSTRCVDH